MNIKNKKPKNTIKQLHLDLEKPSKSQYSKLNLDTVDIVLNTKSKQFALESGVIFAKIDVKIDNPISLNWHYKNTANLEDFITSISKYVAIVEQKLTEIDKSRLAAVYEKYVKELVGEKNTMGQEIVDALVGDK